MGRRKHRAVHQPLLHAQLRLPGRGPEDIDLRRAGHRRRRGAHHRLQLRRGRGEGPLPLRIAGVPGLHQRLGRCRRVTARPGRRASRGQARKAGGCSTGGQACPGRARQDFSGDPTRLKGAFGRSDPLAVGKNPRVNNK
ncbi:MAG: hypothetical protein MZV70_75820 [Desulfobacterales bacterium]|nr:hypothetical protein [Desulfobacterales bacterium]